MADPVPAPDPHVRSLAYSLRSGEGVRYVDPLPLEFERHGISFRLAAGQLTCQMKTHFSNVEAARAVVEPILRAWELQSDVAGRPGEMRFRLAGADVEDRTPVPPGV